MRNRLCDPAIPLPPAFPLIGREQELVQISQRLKDCDNAEVIALHGLPGVGKTALAVALAHDPQVRAEFCDGIVWAALGPHPDLSHLLERWSILLGMKATERVRKRPIGEWRATIREAIGQRRLLIVLDDVWRYEDAQALRVGAPNCAHLLTTRSRALAAQLANARAMLISALNEEESLTLLHCLAPQVTRGEVRLAQDLVEAVGGLPLALTLLGNYLRKQAYSGPARRIATALSRLRSASVRLQISEPYAPVDPRPGLEEQPLSLQSVIAITDQLLPESARAVLYALSVFPARPATFSEEAALAVIGCTTDDLDILSDAGLLSCDGERYSLHQVISDYARLCLKEQEIQETYSRLLTYMAEYVEVHNDQDELLGLERWTIRSIFSGACAGEANQSDLIRLACAFVPFLISHGESDEVECLLKRVQLEEKDERVCALLTQLGGANVPL
jgi:hypothetical protein